MGKVLAKLTRERADCVLVYPRWREPLCAQLIATRASHRPDGNPPQGGPAREGQVALRRWVARREAPRRQRPPSGAQRHGQVAASPPSSGASRLELEAASAPGVHQPP